MGSWFESRLRSLRKGSWRFPFLFGETRMGNGTVEQSNLTDSESLEHLGEATAPSIRSGPKAFRALRHRNYQLFFFGQMISIVGTWMQATALPLLIIQLVPQEQAGVWLGIIGFVPLIPLIPLALVAGSLSDRFPKRTIIVGTQTVVMLQAFVLAALTNTGTIQIWQILLLTFVSGAANAIDVPARQAFVVEMVGDPTDLGSGIALNSAIFNLGRAIGPVLAGLLIAPLGFSVAFLINGLSFLAVIAGLLLMRLPPMPRQTQPAKMRAHLKEGLSYVWHHETLKVLMSLVAVSAFLSMPFITLMPLFVQSVFLPDGTLQPVGPLAASAMPINNWVCGWMTCQDPTAVPYGLLLGMFGVGALIGALLAGSYGDRGRGRLLTLGNLGFPIALLIFAVSKSFWLSMCLLFGVGILFILQNALSNTLVQVTSPDRLRGRVMSVYSLVFQGMAGAGRMQAGLVEGFVSAPFSVAIGALVSLIYGLFVFFKWPQIRHMK
jgi:MFS family permease